MIFLIFFMILFILLIIIILVVEWFGSYEYGELVLKFLVNGKILYKLKFLYCSFM